MTNKEKYAQLEQQINQLQKEFNQTAKALFTEGSKELFDNNPELVSFRWSQYTPYFNDGDACTFHVNYEVDVVVTVDGEEVEVEKYDGNHSQDELVNTVEEFLAAFSEDNLLVMFDDHVEVTVNRDGVTTEEYSHD